MSLTPHTPNNQQGIWRLKRWTEKTDNQAYLELALTFIAIIFFGWFALRLTFVTISELYAEMKNLETTIEKLDDKIESLAAMQLLYQQVADQLPLIDHAMPNQQNLTEFIAQMEVIANETGLEVEQITYSEVYLDQDLQLKQQKSNARRSRTSDGEIEWVKLNATITAKGNYQSIKQFLIELNRTRRIFIIDSLSITLDNKDDNARTVRINGYIAYY